MDSFRNARIINPGFGKKAFSKIEIRDILISILVLSVSFTIILVRGNPTFFSNDMVKNILSFFLLSVVMVVFSFMLHEMGHKFVAQRMGAWSEYRMYPMGLGLCLIFSLIGFLFAAPGAVYIAGRIDDKMNGKISIAGPAVNLVLGFICYGLWFVTTGRVSAIFFLMAHLNGFLAAFNMIPIFPLDGSKILKWNPVVFVVALALGVSLVLLTW